MERLIEYAEQGRLVVFVGAGVSMVPPTCLPSWWDLNQAVVIALAEQIGGLYGDTKARELAELIIARQRANKFPPEYQAEIIVSRLRESYFEVLQCLDGDEPNATHLALASLAKAGKVKAILTTNFDRVLEAGFQRVGVPLDVHSHPDHFASLASTLDRFERSDSPCQLLKLHGSAEDPSTLIDTLAQRKVGFPQATTDCARYLLRFGHWLFLGYSGADLEADPQYLYLRGEVGKAKGFTWLVRTGSTPLPAVERTAEIYGDRANIEFGELPGWLESATASLLVEALPKVEPLDETELERRKRHAHDAVVSHAQTWAKRVGRTNCVLVMSSLLKAIGEPQAALDLLTTLYNSVPEAERGEVSYGVIAASLASLHSDSGAYDDALVLFKEALASFERADATAKRAQALNNMALIAESRGQYDEALNHFREALTTFEKTGDKHAQSVALHNIALVYGAIGDYDEAERLYREELAIVERLGDEPARALVLNTWGELLVRRNKFDTALKLFDDALRIRERLGDDRGRAQCLGNMATVHQHRSNFSEARRLYGEALTIFERLDDQPNRARTLGNIARIASEQGEYEEAIELLVRGLKLSTQAGSEPERARLLMNLGAIHQERNEFDKAQKLLNEALIIRERLGDPSGRGDILNELGILHWSLGELDQAEKVLQEALAIREELHQDQGRSQTLTNLALLAQDRGEYDHALKLLSESLAIDERLGLAGSRAKALANIARTYWLKDDLDQALREFGRALEAFERIGARGDCVRVLSAMAAIYGWQGRLEKSLWHFREADRRSEDPSERMEVCRRLGELAMVYFENGHNEAALQLHRECLRINEEIGHALGAATAKVNIGTILLLGLNQPAAALPFYEEAVEVFDAEGLEIADWIEQMIAQCRQRLRDDGNG